MSIMEEIFNQSRWTSSTETEGRLIWTGFLGFGTLFPLTMPNAHCHSSRKETDTEASDDTGTRHTGHTAPELEMTGFLSDLVQYHGLFQMVIILGIGGTFQVGFQISTITYMNQKKMSPVQQSVNDSCSIYHGLQQNVPVLRDDSHWTLPVWCKCRELLGSQSRWPMLIASCGIPALVQLFTLPFFPESPPYLLMHKEDQEGCKKAIRQLWGEGHHQAEIDDIMKEKATMKNIKILSVLELMKEPAIRWQLYMIIILTTSTQLCGNSAIYFYTFEVLQAAGFDEGMIYYMTLSVGLAELLATVVCDWYFWMPYCSLCLIILFVVVFGLGPGGATVSTRVEIFKLSCRPPAFVISSFINWLGVFVIGTTFPFIVEGLKHFCFLIFIAVLFTSAILIHLFLPETKGKSIVEITEEFDKLNFKKKHTPATPNHVMEEGYTFCTRL
ncbi:hypothetical protein ASZ78_008761 [Callipepla squamata]|uniref:Major facilitator superfamily (MFS) profile domain-containing protein n=1 Tax=Callipepla squamata TaxID=9009 RepID=A0A226NAP9_CALSU|nr:hypothetical protein ASZ78_008761 [Callipepla squamata]